MNQHLPVDVMDTDEDGRYYATCSCGFQRGPLPDLGEVMTVLMDHVRTDDREANA